MGQNSEDIIDGACCELCGCYFADPEDSQYIFEHGHPVTCWGCWDDLDEDEQTQYQRAAVETL